MAWKSLLILPIVFSGAITERTCVFSIQQDFANNGVRRWALPFDARCTCTKVVYFKPPIRMTRSCGYVRDIHTGGFWFTDRPGILTDENVWNTEKLKYLLACPYEETDECSPNPCLHSGTCRELLFSFMCLCAAGYEGKICEKEADECSPNPCLHDGTCRDGLLAFQCLCANGYEGDICEKETDECSPNPCFHDGTCQDLFLAFKCSCADSYDGHTCESETDECSPNPCLHDGTCQDLFLEFTCTCADGYNGNTCELETDECSPNPCLHDGTCQDMFLEFTCTCADGYNGITCELETDECSPNPCLHDGTCQDQFLAFMCICAEGYEGNKCELETDECSPNPCLHDGTCQDKVLAFMCLCADGYKGDTCEIAIPKNCGDIQSDILPGQGQSPHQIDPDGPDGLEPFFVTCDSNGDTIVNHDLEPDHHVIGKEEPGDYIKTITYTSASLQQIVALIDSADMCKQYIRLQCNGAKYSDNDNAEQWWQNRNGEVMSNWGTQRGTFGCQCGTTGDCVDDETVCQCDKNDSVWREDEGDLSDKEDLPVTAVSISDTGDESEEAKVTVGPLVCSSFKPQLLQ